MFRLFIQDQEAEINSNTKIQLNRLILDLEDFSKRGITFTNTINLPFTKLNDAICGNPSRLASNNRAFEVAKEYTLTFKENVISYGTVIVKEFDRKKGISIQLAEGFNFWSLTGKSLLNDLDLFQYDFVFTDANMGAREAYTDSPWLVALSSMAGDTTETALNDYVYTRPMYRYRRIVDEIIAQAGYTVDYTNIFELTNYDQIGFLSNTARFYVSDFMRRWQNVTFTPGQVGLNTGASVFSKSGNSVISSGSIVNQLYKTAYVIKGYVESSIESSIDISYTLGSVAKTERVVVPIGRTFINFITDEIEIGSTTTVTIPFDMQFIDMRFYSLINEVDIFEIEGRLEHPDGHSEVEDYLVVTDYNLPDHTQKQFLKNFMKMLFLKADIDEQEKRIKFSYFPDILSTNNAIDIREKVNKYPPIKAGVAYGRLNVLRYENDSDIDPTLSAAYFNVQSDNAISLKEFLLVSEFSASVETRVSGNTCVDVAIYNITDQKRESVKDRIVEFNTGTGIPFTANMGGVSWQRLYNENYQEFIESTSRERIVSVEALLTYTDFRKISNTPIVYIEDLKSYFLCTEISGFEIGQFTRLDLIKYQ